MKKSTVIMIIIVIVLYFIGQLPYLYEEGNLLPNDYARITDVDYTAVVVDEPNSCGKVIITEKLTFDIHAASRDNLFWELWRDLPEDYIDGLKVEYKVNSVKQILEDGSEIIYGQSNKLYWDDYDYIDKAGGYGPGKWYHSEGPYDEYAAQYECLLFYVDGLYREKITFEIEYEMSNAALRYNDASELYLCMYSEETINHLKSFKGQILIPEKDMPITGNYEAHTYGTNYNSFDFIESDTANPGYHTFSFDLDEKQLKFKPYNEYIEFSLISFGMDKHKFTEYAPRNYYSNDNVLTELRMEHEKYTEAPDNFKDLKIIVLVLCLIIAYFILKNLLKTDSKIKNKHIFYNPSMQMHYFREIPSNLDPYFAAALVFSKNKMPKDVDESYAAIMLSLVRKKYIELAQITPGTNWNFHNVKIIIKYKPMQTMLTADPLNMLTPELPIQQELEALTPNEELYFNLIVRHSLNKEEITLSQLQTQISTDYMHTASFVEKIENSVVNIGISQGYFQKANYEEPKKELLATSRLQAIWGILITVIPNVISYQTRLDFAFGGFFIVGLSLIISSLYLRKIANKYILLTQFGEDEYSKWYGLYNFLNSETLMDERTVVELPMWEQYLIYATAFGISDKVIKALNIRCPEIEIQNSPILSNNYYRSHSFYSSSRSFRTATRSASHFARSSYGGGFGGHGGYGGGGRGGGGGRRRSLIFQNLKRMNVLFILFD